MSNPDTKKHTLYLRDGDWDFIESIYKPHGIGTSTVIRTLVSNYVDKKRADLRNEDTTDLKLDTGL